MHLLVRLETHLLLLSFPQRYGLSGIFCPRRTLLLLRVVKFGTRPLLMQTVVKS
jgi:hypothetical protein